MVSTTDVKRALSALATRTDTATRPSVAVIDEADDARSDLRRAAGFVDADGLDRLDEAIAAAERAGDEAAAERGRRARAAFRRFREAAAGGDSCGGDNDRAGDGSSRQPPDHFRPAPGTPKPDTGQDPGR
ncbi:hypothetical protein [Halorubrum sp. CSM-61]|uniref:hypothetical protein n=1 Tax=Halorubrum sp. CSM-61 TaxID=2485838 RepID=UPI000F4C59EF|nr:hypothetical protein [Halorubrum sp. CSM-61]